MALPASITSMSLCGASPCAPTTAAMRSAPNVCGVLYNILMGSLVSVLKCMYGHGNVSNCPAIGVGISITDDTMAFSIVCVLHHSSSVSMSVLLPLWNFFITPDSNSADLQLLLPMSIIRFNLFVGC